MTDDTAFDIAQLDEGACLYESEATVRLAAVGTGPGFMSLMDIVHNEAYRDFLPEMTLTAVARPGPHKGKRAYLEAMGVPLYEDVQTMLAEHPDLTMVVELSEVLSDGALRDLIPRHVSLIDRTGAVFLCGLRDLAQAKAFCQGVLDHQRTLMQTIIDEVREDILLLDRHGRIVDCNRNVVEGAGLPREAILGRQCSEVHTFQGGPAFCCEGGDAACPYRMALETGDKAEAMFTRVDEDGRLRYYRVYAYPIVSAGRVSHITVMRRDITERTRRERQQQQSDKLAVVGEMSMYLAHEIRNPLFAIAGFTRSLLKSEALQGDNRDKVQIIAEETARLERLLTSILNFAKPAEAETHSVDLNEVAEETVSLMRVSCEHQGVELTFTPVPDLPMVKADPELVKQCLVNLIKNSMEAMETTGHIEVRVRRDPERPDLAMLEVEDDGPGMTEEQLAQAFNPFFTTKETGCGLGLALIKKIMDEFGGAVRLASKLGEGATVGLSFPPVVAEELGEGARSADQTRPRPQVLPGVSPKQE